MAKRLAAIIGILGVIGTIVGLYADLSGILGDDEDNSSIKQTNEAADVIIESFSAELTSSHREILVNGQVFNQGDVAAINGTVTVTVEVEGEGISDTLQDQQTFQAVIADSSESFSFVFDVSTYPGGTTFRVQAVAESVEGMFTSNTQTLTKR
jgi:hypothetical protein